MKTDAMRMMMKVMTVCATFVGMNVLAQTATWTGGVDTNWSNASNWSPAVVPNGNSYTAVVDSASATINVDGAYTINKFMIVSNGVESGSTVSLEGPGSLTIDRNSTSAGDGFVNGAEGAGTIMEINCDVIINNSSDTGFGNRTQLDQAGGTANVIRFGPDCTLTLNHQFLSNDGDGRMEFNCTLLGSANFNLYSQNNYFGTGYDDSGYGASFILAGTSQLTFDGGTVTAGNRVQVNSGSATLVFNAANVASGLNIRGNGASSAFHLVVNASQDNMGWLDVGGAPSTIDPVGGTLAFADSSAQSWLGGSLTVSTNFTFGDIRFGTSDSALTELQLVDISADGITGAAVLDASGFLDFAGDPPVITGEIVVDYDTSGGNTNARPADIQTDTGYTWNFSETEPLLVNSGQNRTVYGGLITTWGVATNYVPDVELRNGQILVDVNPVDESGGTSVKGMYVWPKEEFLFGAAGTVSFTNGNAIVIGQRFMTGGVGGQSYRCVVKQGGIYYASSEEITIGGNNQILTFDPADTNVSWAVISTNDYSRGLYGTMTFSDIEAVGIAVEITHTASRSFVTFDDFLTRANVEIPPPSEISDVSGALVGGQYVVSWQGTNTATYILQMKNDLVFDPSWVDVSTNSGVNDIMSVTNATDDPQAFFRTILAE